MRSKSMRALLIALGVAFNSGLHAQEAYPSRLVRFIVPFAAGTAPDIGVRLIGSHLAPLWGQSVIIENRTGAAGNISAAAVSNSAPDGYTFLYAINSVISSNPHLYPKLAFDPRKLVPIAPTARYGFVLMVRSDSQFKNLNELITFAKANPGKLTYSSSGFGGTTHLTTESFLRMTGTQMLHVPITQGSPTQALFSDTGIDVNFAPYPTAVETLRTGRVRALGVSLNEPFGAMPDVPVIGQLVPGYTSEVVNGVFAPPGTPPAIVNKVAADIAKVVATPEMRKRFIDMGNEPIEMTPAEFAEFLREDYEKFGRIIRENNIKPAE
jgi:tripartite-type tricarboxylate transporter receptor subunit TctC